MKRNIGIIMLLSGVGIFVLTLVFSRVSVNIQRYSVDTTAGILSISSDWYVVVVRSGVFVPPNVPTAVAPTASFTLGPPRQDAVAPTRGFTLSEAPTLSETDAVAPQELNSSGHYAGRVELPIKYPLGASIVLFLVGTGMLLTSKPKY